MATTAGSRRLRRTPFSDGAEAAGTKGLENDHHLKAAVQVREVACERQIEIRGPDAGRLMQMLTPRDLRGMLAGMCYDVPMVDELAARRAHWDPKTDVDVVTQAGVFPAVVQETF